MNISQIKSTKEFDKKCSEINKKYYKTCDELDKERRSLGIPSGESYSRLDSAYDSAFDSASNEIGELLKIYESKINCHDN